MKLVVWGTRAAIACPEPECAHFGGNTPCLEVQLSGQHSLIFDAGFGIRWQAFAMLQRQPRLNQVEVLLSSCHWDHIQGIPFNPMMFSPNNQVRFYGHPRLGQSLLDNLKAQLQDEFCPVPDFFQAGVGADTEVLELKKEELGQLELAAGSLSFSCFPGPTPADFVTGYRLDRAGFSLAYLSDLDYGQSPECLEKASRLAQGVDLLIHGGRVPSLPDHCPYRDALALAEKWDCKQLLCCHHAPEAVDAQLQAIAQQLDSLSSRVRVQLAREGQELTLTN